MTGQTEPVAIEPGTPAVRLAGKLWPIPELAWRDLKKCRSALLALTDQINDVIAAAKDTSGEDDDVRAQRNLAAVSLVFQALADDDFDRLVVGPIHAGLQAAHPTLSREEFDGWSFSEAELQLAWLTVRGQSGLFVLRAPGSDGNALSGEVAGVA